MNIKTTITLAISMLCLFVNAQIDINSKDSTINFLPTFKKDLKLSYDVKKVFITNEDENKVAYQIKLRFMELLDDTMRLSVSFSNPTEGHFVMELFDNLEADVLYNLNDRSIEFVNEEALREKIISRLKKKLQDNTDDPEATKELEMMIAKAEKDNEAISYMYTTEIEALFGFYKENLPYNRTVTKTEDVNDPMGNATKNFIKQSIVKDEETYKLTHSVALQNDGIQKAMEEQVTKAFQEQMKDSTAQISLSSEGTQIEGLDELSSQIDISSNINAVFDSKNGIVKSYNYIKKQNVFTFKSVVTREYTLIE